MRIEEIESNSLVERLLAAFNDAEYPSSNEFPGEGDFEAMAEIRTLRGRLWQHLDVENVLTNADALRWLSPTTLRYYLPAYLAVAVSFPNVSQSVSDAIIEQLAPPGRRCGPTTTRFYEMVQGLTTAQRNVIRDCLLRLGVNLYAGIFAYWNDSDSQ